jgi:EmrB/QacA subfamily drug resistance transporter
MSALPEAVPSRHGVVLFIIMVSYLMLVIDISIVLTGLPRIQASLGFSAAKLSWIQNAYTLVFGGFLLLGARAGDILGRRRMFITGLAIFTLASLAIGIAQSAAWMIGARAVQGFGAAILAPSTLALIAVHFQEGDERNRALAWYAAAAGIGATLGLVLGGLLADLISWRAGFLINLPIGLLLIVATVRHIRETERLNGRFDIVGAVTSTLGMCALVLGIVEAAEAGWAATLTQSALAAGVLLLSMFIWIERRASQPLLPLAMLDNPRRNAAYAARLLFLAGMAGFWFFTAQYLQGALGFSALEAGLAFIPVTVPQLMTSISVPRVAARIGQHAMLLAGLAFCVLGLSWLAVSAKEMSYFHAVALPMLFIGFGQGWVLAPLTVAGVAGVEGRNAGVASGLVNVAHQLGASLGLAVLVVVYAGGHPPVFEPIAMAHHTGITMAAAALLLLASLGISARYIRFDDVRRRHRPEMHAGENRG